MVCTSREFVVYLQIGIISGIPVCKQLIYSGDDFWQLIENQHHHNMQFNVDGKAFQQMLQAVSKVINAKNSLKILENFLLKVEGDILSITGSDSENVMTARMAITESESDGIIAVSAKRLLEITKEVSNQPLTISIDESTKEIDIVFLNGHFNFMGLPGEEYPLPRALDAECKNMILPASMVLRGIENTIYAASTETVRPVMTGIYWDIHENDVTFVSSDTHKLVRYINTEKAPGITAAFVLPPKPANILRSTLTKDSGEVSVTFDAKGCIFEFGDFTLSSMFINGMYPNYARVIPPESPFVLTIDRGSLLTALRRVTLFASKASNLVVLNVQPNEVLLRAQDLDYGMSAEERVNCQYEGNMMTIGFNGAFMIEILGNMKDDTVLLKLTDPARPGVYEPLEQAENENILVIQMPMQVL